MQRAYGNAAVSRAVAVHKIQRYVDAFEAETAPTPTPAEDLKATLRENSDLFEESDEEMEGAVEEARLAEQGTEDIEKPEAITARLRAGKRRSPKRDDLSGTVGWIGHDEFYIKTGVQETFEGGHVIPHALFDEDDDAADQAGAFENLVPMSRFVNIGVWKEKEAAIKSKLSEIAKADDEGVEHSLDVTIPIDTTIYKVWASVLLERFGLTFNDGVDDKELSLYEWIPRRIGPVQTQHIRSRISHPESPLSEGEFSQAEDNPLRQWTEEIQSGEELLAAIKRLGLRVHPDLLELVRILDK